MRILTLGGATAKARELQGAVERANAQDHSREAEQERHTINGDIAMAEQRWADAVASYRKADVSMCRICALPDLARAYDLGGKPDSAIAVFERYVTSPDILRSGVDPVYLAGARKRLGELYDARGDAANAATHFAAFVELWKNADAELQPKVREARARLEALRAKEKR